MAETVGTEQGPKKHNGETPGRKSMLGLAICGGLFAAAAFLFCWLRRGDGASSCGTFSPTCVAGCIGSAIFVLYAAGLAALFFWLIYRTYKHEIDLLSAITRDEGRGGVSLSKLQIFLWTLVLVFAWLYQLALEPGEFPEMPSQALVLLGLSGATYLGVKQIEAKKDKPAAQEKDPDA